MIIRKALSLSKEDYHQVHLALINALLPEKVKMTPKEIEVLGIFMSLEGELAIDRFGTTARKIVKNKMNISDGGLGNYLKSLKDKKLLIDNGVVITMHAALQVEINQQDYQFRLTKKVDVAV